MDANRPMYVKPRDGSRGARRQGREWARWGYLGGEAKPVSATRRGCDSESVTVVRWEGVTGPAAVRMAGGLHGPVLETCTRVSNKRGKATQTIYVTKIMAPKLILFFKKNKTRHWNFDAVAKLILTQKFRWQILKNELIIFQWLNFGVKMVAN